MTRILFLGLALMTAGLQQSALACTPCKCTYQEECPQIPTHINGSHEDCRRVAHCTPGNCGLSCGEALLGFIQPQDNSEFTVVSRRTDSLEGLNFGPNPRAHCHQDCSAPDPETGGSCLGGHYGVCCHTVCD